MTNLINSTKKLTKKSFGIPYDVLYFSNNKLRAATVDVTIYSASYNHHDYLDDYFDGINSQVTSYHVEVVIIDDHSEDNSWKKLVTLAARSKFDVKIIRFKENQHHNKATRALIGLSHATGDYIAYCETDDYWVDSQKIDKQVSFLKKNPDYSWSLTKATRIDEETAVDRCMLDTDCADLMSFTDEVLALCWGQLPTASMLFRRDVIELHSELMSKRLIVQPTEHLAVMSAVSLGLCYFIPSVTTIYRFNSRQSFTRQVIQNYCNKMMHYRWTSELYTDYVLELSASNLYSPVCRLVIWQCLQYVKFLYPHIFYAAFDASLKKGPKISKDAPTLIFGSGLISNFLIENFSTSCGKYLVFDSSSDPTDIEEFCEKNKTLRIGSNKNSDLVIIVTPSGFGAALRQQIEELLPNGIETKFFFFGDAILDLLCEAELGYLRTLRECCLASELAQIPTPASKGPLCE